MLKLVTTNQFEKDLRRMVKRDKDAEKLLQLMQRLLSQERLDKSYRNHKLRGPFAGRWECHIEHNWLLIYVREQDRIVFERTGTHSDLFR